MDLYFIFTLAVLYIMTVASDNNIAPNRVTYVQKIENQNWNNQIRICADFEKVSHFIRTELEPIFEPVLDLLPEFYQIELRKGTNLRISIISCIFFSLISVVFLSTWFFLLRSINKKKINYVMNQQDEIVSLNLQIKEISLQNELLMMEAVNCSSKFNTCESKLNETEAELNELNENFLNLKNLNNSLNEQLKSLNLKEKNIQLELDNFKQSNESLKSNQIESKALIEKLNVQIEHFKALESQLRQESILKENKIAKLESIISLKPNLDCINQECGRKIINLKKEIDDLESKIEQYRQMNSVNRSELEQKELLITNFDSRLEEKERLLRESEMQIKLLNDLREKDTKQHIKSLSEMDMELKKKSCDSEKINNLYEQLRIKQERIQDLEIQLVKIEKQWNAERQTFEKQIHENWINGKKVEKELKDTKSELSLLTVRFNDLLSESNQLRQQNKSFFQADNSFIDNKSDQQLQIDTNQFEISRPSSATSSSSGINSGIGGPHIPPFYTRFPFKHPFALSSPNPDLNQMPQVPFNYAAYQQIMYKMMMQSRSACSSQQASPCPNMPTSSSYPNSLNGNFIVQKI